MDSLGRAPDSQLSQGVQNRDIGDVSDSHSAPRPQPGILKHHVSASGSLSLRSHYRATGAKALSLDLPQSELRDCFGRSSEARGLQRVGGPEDLLSMPLVEATKNWRY